jgi:hypothetical protein
MQNLKGCFLHSESLGLFNLSTVRNFKELEKVSFLKTDLLPSSGEGRETLC